MASLLASSLGYVVQVPNVMNDGRYHSQLCKRTMHEKKYLTLKENLSVFSFKDSRSSHNL